jgi:hypothetical protein
MWAWAALMGMLTASCRIVGVVIWGVVIYEWLTAQGWTLRGVLHAAGWRNLWSGLRREWPGLAISTVIPLGLLSYMAFLAVQFGDPLAFWTTQSAWGREALGPIAIVWRDLSTLLSQDFMRGEIYWQVLVDLSALALVLGMSVPIGLRFGAGYTIYCLLGVLIPASSGTGSLSRYTLILFPLFLVLAAYGKHAWFDKLMTLGGAMFLGLFTAIFVNWYFLA